MRGSHIMAFCSGKKFIYLALKQSHSASSSEHIVRAVLYGYSPGIMSPAENAFGLFTVTQCVVWLWVNLSQGLGQLRAILDTGCRRDFNRQGKKRSPPLQSWFHHCSCRCGQSQALPLCSDDNKCSPLSLLWLGWPDVALVGKAQPVFACQLFQ